MFDWLVPGGSATQTLLEWKWANAHPYLFTFIKVSPPSAAAVALIVGVKMYLKLCMRGR